MKALIIILLLCSSVSTLDGQNYGSMNKEQLNLALKNAKNKTNVGISLAGMGVLMGVSGMVLYSHGISSSGTGGDMFNGVIITIAGLGLMGAGIPTWLAQSNKKNKIKVELLRSDFTGFRNQVKSGPVYGVGLKFTF